MLVKDPDDDRGGPRKRARTHDLNGPQCFNCNLEHNRTTNCSLIKMFDILNTAGPGGEGDSQTAPASFLMEHLFDSFNYLPSSDLKCLILGNDAYLEQCYKVPDDGLETSINLFGYVDIPIVRNPETVITTQTLSVLFQFAKKNLGQIRSCLGDVSYGSSTGGIIDNSTPPLNEDQFTQFRQSISDFMNFLKRFLYLITGNSGQSSSNAQTTGNPNSNLNLFQLCSSILKELKFLLLFAGRLNQFCRYFWTKKGYSGAEIPFQNRMDRKTPLYNYYHAVLEIWWSAVEITYLIQVGTRHSFNDICLVREDSRLASGGSFAGKISGHPLFTQSVRILLYDILLLGSKCHFETNFLPGTDYQYQSPFICTCSWEVIVALRMLLCTVCNSSNNNNSDSLNSSITITITLDSFYEVLFEVLNLFQGNSKSDSIEAGKLDDSNDIIIDYFESIALSSVQISNSVNYRLFQVWVFTNIVPLLPIDLNFESNPQIGSHKITVPSSLIKLYRTTLKDIESALNSISFQETMIYNLLNLTLKNSQFMSNANFDLLILFVEHFLKKLNVNYNVQRLSSTGIQEYSWMPRNSSRWLKAVEEERFDGNFGLNLFKLFLSFLDSQLDRLFSDSENLSDTKTQNLNFQKLISKIVVTLQPKSLEKLEPMGVFNLCTFYLTIISSIPSDRWKDISDKVLSVLNVIGRNTCSNAKPNGSILELLMQFHFALFQLNNTKPEVNAKIVSQLGQLFEKFQQELFKSSLNQYHTIMKLYFVELENLIDLIRKRCLKITLLEPLLLNLDLKQIFRSLRSSKSSDVPLSKIMESLGEVTQFAIKMLQDVAHKDADFDVDMVPSSDLQEAISTSISREDQKEIVEFSRKFNDKLKELIQTELVPFADETNLEIIANLAFNVTLLYHLIENQVVPNPSLLTTIKYFLNLPDKPQTTSFQLNYLSLLFEEFQIISHLKEEQQYCTEVLSSETSVLLLSTWCRLLPFGITKFPEKISSISRNLFRNLLEITGDDNSVSTTTGSEVINIEDETINCYKLFLRTLDLKYRALNNFQEKSNHRSLFARYFGPFVQECRSTMASAKTANVKQLKSIYWLVAYLVNYCAAQMYQMGQADCLLALVVEHLLIVPNGSVIDGSDCTISKCFYLIFEGLCHLNPDGDPYLGRKMRQLIVFYLPFLVKGSSVEQIKIVFTQKQLYHQWQCYLLSSIEKIYLVQKDQVIVKSVFDYIARYCTSLDRPEVLMRLLAGLRSSVVLNDFNPKDYRVMLWQVVVRRSVEMFDSSHDLVKQFMDNILMQFVRANLQNRPAKCFEVLKYLLPPSVHRTSSVIFHELCSELHRLLDDVERRSIAGNHMVLRKLLKDFITNYEQSTA